MTIMSKQMNFCTYRKSISCLNTSELTSIPACKGRKICLQIAGVTYQFQIFPCLKVPLSFLQGWRLRISTSTKGLLAIFPLALHTLPLHLPGRNFLSLLFHTLPSHRHLLTSPMYHVLGTVLKTDSFSSRDLWSKEDAGYLSIS